MTKNVANARGHALLGAAALAITTVSAAYLPAAAADSSPQASPQDESQSAVALPENGKLQMVTVTAERYVSTVQQTPIAITVLSGGQLQSQGITDLQSAISGVPALHVQASPQGAQLYIRGVGTNGDSNWVDPDVALMFDGVYNGRAEAALSSLYDVNRIEVLKGPQGTLYGRNAVGGVINIDTNDPIIGRYEAGANLGTGNYRLMHADGYLNLPISDTFAIRLAGERETHSGYYSNGGGAEHMVSTRLKALWEPSDDFSTLATINYWHEQGIAETTVSTSNAPWAAAAYSSYGTYNANNPWYVGPLVLGPPGAATVANLLPNDDDYEFLTYSLKTQWNLGWGTLVLLPGYSYSNRYTLTQLFAPGAREPTSWWERQYTGEARLVSPDDSPLRWVAGVYVLSTDETTAGVPAGGATFLYFPPTDHPAKSVAEFGQITYPLTSRLRLTGGVRYTRDEKNLTYSVCTSDEGTSCNGVYTLPETTLSDSYSAITYKAGVQYDLRQESMLYADVATGYKAGGFQLTDPPLPYKPEKLTAYEIGSKNRFLDDHLQLDAALYYYRYDNYQVEYQGYVPYTTTVPAQYIPAGSGEEFTQFVANAGTGRNVGAEVGLKYRFTRHDQLDIDLAYVDARYGNLTVPTTGGPPGTTNDSGFFDFDGQPVANTPRQSAMLGYEHDWSAYGGLLSLRLQSKVSAGYYASADEWFAGGAVWQPGFTRSSSFLSYVTPGGMWNVDLWARNLENHGQITYIYPFYRAELSDPRTYGVTVGYRFQ